MEIDLTAVVAQQPDPLLFATVSGAHLYGFPSKDSDVDLRGAHLLPAAELLSLRAPEETRSRMWFRDGTERDLMRSAQVQAHLPTLLEEVPEAPGCLGGLIEAKVEAEHAAAGGIDAGRVERDFEALHGVLEAAQGASRLPEHADAFEALDEFVVRRRAR